MEYKFQILTTEGIKESIVESNSNFSCAPFGFVPYRFVSTCECSQEILDDFWRCIDVVLKNNNLTSENYIRTIRAISNEIIFGEIIIENTTQVTSTINPQDTWVGYPGINK